MKIGIRVRGYKKPKYILTMQLQIRDKRIAKYFSEAPIPPILRLGYSPMYHIFSIEIDM